MFTAEAKKYDPDNEEQETFATWEKACQWCLDMQKYGFRSFWINGDRVKIHKGVVYNAEDEREVREWNDKRPVPTNPATVAVNCGMSVQFVSFGGRHE